MTCLTSLSPAAPAHHPADDWELMLDAALAKLRQLAGNPPPRLAWPPSRTPPGDALALLQAGVLECAVALEQIRGLICDRIALAHLSAARGAEG